jgi:[NiFe] hydrogenase assembly HybE family chaperone
MTTSVEKLVQDYQRIAEERMRGLPLYNNSLSVEAIAFRDWEGRQLGVLITPWFMNLILLPADGEHWSDRGMKTEWEFPSGRYEFDTCDSDEAGPHQSAALFSTVGDFPDQKTAREVACEVMVRLFQRNTASQEKHADAEPALDSLMQKEMSRRDLFRWLAPGADDDGRHKDA